MDRAVDVTAEENQGIWKEQSAEDMVFSEEKKKLLLKAIQKLNQGEQEIFYRMMTSEAFGEVSAEEIISAYEVDFEEGLKAGNIVMESYEIINDTTLVLNYVCFTQGVEYGGGNEKIVVRCQKEDVGTFQLMDTACGRTFYSKWKQEITVTPMELKLERQADDDLELVLYFKDGSSLELLIVTGESSLSFIGNLLFVDTMGFVDVNEIDYIVYEGLKYQ